MEDNDNIIPFPSKPPPTEMEPLFRRGPLRLVLQEQGDNGRWRVRKQLGYVPWDVGLPKDVVPNKQGQFRLHCSGNCGHAWWGQPFERCPASVHGGSPPDGDRDEWPIGMLGTTDV